MKPIKSKISKFFVLFDLIPLSIILIIIIVSLKVGVEEDVPLLLLLFLAIPLGLIAGKILNFYFATREVTVDEENIYVHYMWHSQWDYSLPLKIFDSYCIMSEQIGKTVGQKRSTIYLCDKNKVYYFIEDSYLSNYDQMLAFITKKLKLPEKKIKVTFLATMPRYHMWRGRYVIRDLE